MQSHQEISMKKTILSLILLIPVFALTAGEDLLKNKFNQRLQIIADTSDAVVGIYIKDFSSGEEYSINANEIFPLASTIKITILCEVFRQSSEKKYSLSDLKIMKPEWRVGGSGILSELGEKSVTLSVHDFAVCMIVQSDNAATNLLIDLAGIQQINSYIRSLGLSKTTLQRVMMDYKAAAQGKENIGTPRETGLLLEKLYKGELVSKGASAEMLSIMKKDKPGALRKGILPNIPIANKEGEIEGIRCDAGIIFLENHPYVICVMTKLLPSSTAGTEIISAVSRTAFNYFERMANSNEYGRRIPR
jgi:beta-lactamase class A